LSWDAKKILFGRQKKGLAGGFVPKVAIVFFQLEMCIFCCADAKNMN